MSNEIDRDVAALAAAIRAQMRGRGLTQEEVAKRAGIPTSTFETYISEKKPVDIKMTRVRKIAAALGMTTQELIIQSDYWYEQQQKS